MTQKKITKQEEWGQVLKELESEHVKLASYDHTLLLNIGDVTGKAVLDYGSGPGVLALGLQKAGADTKIWDISDDMRQKASQKIGSTNVYDSVADIPDNHFDIVICNLVLCIVTEEEVKVILENIFKSIKPNGLVYVGFCNPKIFSVAESNLDFRFPTGDMYSKNHDYKKIKKEGGYEIIESHRPIEWYEDLYRKHGFKLLDTLFTPDYTLKNKDIKDFVIHKLQK